MSETEEKDTFSGTVTIHCHVRDVSKERAEMHVRNYFSQCLDNHRLPGLSVENIDVALTKTGPGSYSQTAEKAKYIGENLGEK